MKHIFSTLFVAWMSTAVWAAGINYDGTNLDLCNEFTRTECGKAYKSVMKEVSGMACSRQTPGFIWVHGDENTGSDKKIVAIKPNGELVMTLNISGDPGRDDWEDIATGVYNGKNYIMIGAIGDNDLEYADSYYIYYLEEPAITSGTQTVTVSYIRFGYPDGQAHNTETLMYDNIEQMFYIADKIDGSPCSLYSLPFRTDYGTSVQTLTKVVQLGTSNKFDFLTAGDITPDGRWMAIKNKQYLLLWERQGTESLSVTATRRPVQVAAYEEEKQGESIAWADDSTFYTTSDQKDDVPIYKYTRGSGSGQPDDPETPVDSTKKQILEVVMSNHYYGYIPEGETTVHARYLAGTAEPTVSSHKVSDGATWAQDGTNITVTALDGSTAQYTLLCEPVSPAAYTPNLITFDGTETYVSSAYGWDGTKKWRFSKTDDDYSREIAGKTHVELFLPACDTVVVYSMSSKERAVRFYIDGTQIGDKVTLSTNGNTLAVNRQEAFMLSVVSAQSSGDGGVAAIRMARKSATGMEAYPEPLPEGKGQKILRNGQLLIVRGGKTYNAQGIEVDSRQLIVKR